MSVMHYLCKDLASKAPVLLDFHKDLESLESAQESLAEEVRTTHRGLDKLGQELTASESDGPVSEVFRKTLKEFIAIAESELVATLSIPYCLANKNVDALLVYFGEDPYRCKFEHCTFEQVTGTLSRFIRSFKKAYEENIKQEELEKKEKAAKEVEMEEE